MNKFNWLNSNFLIISVIIGIILGILISNVLIGKPEIGLIKIDGVISSEKVDSIIIELRELKEDNKVKAVVLEIDSPGGGAANVEEIYLDLLELRKEKPVVVVINGRGASGAYYIAVASNFIYAKPSSEIGGIGVISFLPKKTKFKENVIISGPFKEIGESNKERIETVQLIAESFIRAVMDQRGDKLKLDREELFKAKVYTGIEAVNNGMIDDIGSIFNALDKAAQLAGISSYEVKKDDKNKEEIIIQLDLFSNESALDLKESEAFEEANYFYLPSGK